MTKTVRNSLFVLLTAILAISVILFSATFANAKAESYDGLTGTKDKSEVTSVVELDSFVVDEDASIRLVAPYGVRFTTVIDKEDVDKLPFNAKFGTILLPKSMLDGELTLSTPSIVVGYANNYGVAEGGLSYYYRVALIGNESESLATEFYNMELCARSFVTYKYSGVDGDVEDTIYTDTLTSLPKETANETLAQRELFELSDDAVSLLKTVVQEEDKIGYFDTAYGASQFTSAYSGEIPMVSTEYSTEVKYDEEKGSTKFTWNAAPYGNGECIYFTDLIQKDVSDYDYIMFRIYNPNDFDIVFKFSPWFGYTSCTANSWSYVKATAEEITSAKALTDITGLTLLFDGGDQLIGKSVYLSAMYAVKEEVIELEGTKLFNFDESSINVYPNNTQYSTEIKYGNEKGSTKVVMTSSNTLLFEAWGFAESDLTAYDYIIMRVYNANDYAIKFHINWCGTTTCAVGEWTEVKINTSSLYDASAINGKGFYAQDDATNQGREGLTIYLSALYGCNE